MDAAAAVDADDRGKRLTRLELTDLTFPSRGNIARTWGRQEQARAAPKMYRLYEGQSCCGCASSQTGTLGDRRGSGFESVLGRSNVRRGARSISSAFVVLIHEGCR